MFGIINLFIMLFLYGIGVFVLYLIIRLAVRHGIDSSQTGQKILRDNFTNKG